jgi:hypothetical protein
MALFQKQGDISQDIMNLRTQGLADEQIIDELKGKGYHEAQVMTELNKVNTTGVTPPSSVNDFSMNEDIPSSAMPQAGPSNMGGMPQNPMPPSAPIDAPPRMSSSSGPNPNQDTSIYDRIEEIAENLIDEKWDDLIAEVKKIISWKDKVEEENKKIKSDLEKLKEDFKTLHQAVLGKVEEYDSRMRDVGTELKAVGKVFKDVVPIFTENVKELKSITGGMKDKK